MENSKNILEKKQSNFTKNVMPFIILIGVLTAVTLVLSLILNTVF